LTYYSKEEEIKIFLADVFKTVPDKISSNLQLGMIRGWDSLGHMNLILAIEDKLGRKLNSSEILKIINFDEIKNILS
jgi:acyl carrier protein